MKFFPDYPPNPVLKEQVKVVDKNFIAGLLAYYSVVCTGTISVYFLSPDQRFNVLCWFVACSVVVIGVFLKHRKNRRIIDEDTRKLADFQVRSTMLIGALFGIFILFFMDGNNDKLVAVTGFLATGTTAGAMAMLSASLPVFYTALYTSLPSLALKLLIQSDPFLMLLGLATVIYSAVLTICAYNIERSIRRSIELRLENDELVEELKASVAETEKANHDKSVFLASASHDLRQPLHAMGLFIDTLSNTRLSELQQELVSQIAISSDATRDMLNTLLNFSKLDAGVVEPKKKAFKLQNLLQKLENELAVGADAKQLIYRTRETTATAYTDPNLLELILRNLISNAIRYTENGGILVGCRLVGNQSVSIEVWDTGIGIPQGEQEAIFKEFHQLDNPERDRQKGFGLGLAIVKGISDTLGHKISVTSDVDRGSVFKIQLPLSDELIIQNIYTKNTMPRFDEMRVLFIDDDRNILKSMHRLLTNWGCICYCTESEAEALTIIQEQSLTPDLLIVDYRLRENRTGGQAIKAVRSIISQDLPAIIITGDTAPDRLREAKAHDALLLHKPVAATELQDAISSVVCDELSSQT